MRVLIITDTFPPAIGGTGAFFYNIASSLPDEVLVVTVKRDGRGNPCIGWREADAALPFPVRRVDKMRCTRSNRGLFSRAFHEVVRIRAELIPQLWSILNSVRPDVVCLGTMGNAYWMKDIVRLWGKVPVVAFAHGEEVPVQVGTRLHDPSRQRAFRTTDLVIAVSNFTLGTLLQIGVPSDRIRVVHPGVDVKRFTPGPKDESILKRYGLSGKRVILTLARLDERKGHEVVIRSLPKVLAQVPDAVYVIAGGGNHRAALEQEVVRRSVEHAVVFTGPVPPESVAPMYRSSDLFVMPNRTLKSGDTEGFGLVFLEAGACGKPVIGGNAGGVPEAIIHQETGLIVDSTSSDAVADGIVSILSDERIACSYGQAGLKHALDNDWTSKARRVREVFQEALLLPRYTAGGDVDSQAPVHR